MIKTGIGDTVLILNHHFLKRSASAVSLYRFIKNNTTKLTEDWYASLDKSKEGVYGAKEQGTIDLLKQQNHQFHLLFSEKFHQDSKDINQRMDRWIDTIATDDEHLNTPTPEIIEEFLNVQDQYLSLLTEYKSATDEQIDKWVHYVTNEFKQIVVSFTTRRFEQYDQYKQEQSELINKLSAPVIELNQHISLLPLVGDINSQRAKAIFEQTLNQCVDQRVNSLLIDLSGVPQIDKAVANQIYTLIEGLRLIGTTASLSGMRSELASTTVNSGIQFKSVCIYSSVPKALEDLVPV